MMAIFTTATTTCPLISSSEERAELFSAFLLDFFSDFFDILAETMDGIAAPQHVTCCDQQKQSDSFFHIFSLGYKERTSTKCPATPAAAAIAGLTR
jgi:hypothetical protein